MQVDQIITMDELLTKHLASPPFIRLPVADYISCSRLMKVNNEAVAVLETCISENSSLWTEIEILERSMFKVKSKWRLEPLYRGVKQVLKCMLILRSQDILTTILEALDSVLGLDGKTLVPSKQYLEFLLVKIIGVGRLAVQTIDYCVYSQSKLMGKLEIGHVLSSVISFTSFVSRVWVLCHTLLIQISKCYHAIYSLHLLSTAAEYTWLPDGLTLPNVFPFDVESIISKSSPKLKTRESTEPFGGAPNAQPLSEHASDSQAKDRLFQANTIAQDLRLLSEQDVGVAISRKSFHKSLEQAIKVEDTAGVNDRKKQKTKKRKAKTVKIAPESLAFSEENLNQTLKDPNTETQGVRKKKRRLDNTDNLESSLKELQEPKKKLKVKTPASVKHLQNTETINQKIDVNQVTGVYSVEPPVAVKKKIKKKKKSKDGCRSTVNSDALSRINTTQKRKTMKFLHSDTTAAAPIKKRQTPGKQSKSKR